MRQESRYATGSPRVMAAVDAVVCFLTQRESAVCLLLAFKAASPQDPGQPLSQTVLITVRKIIMQILS